MQDHEGVTPPGLEMIDYDPETRIVTFRPVKPKLNESNSDSVSLITTSEMEQVISCLLADQEDDPTPEKKICVIVGGPHDGDTVEFTGDSLQLSCDDGSTHEYKTVQVTEDLSFYRHNSISVKEAFQSLLDYYHNPLENEEEEF